MTTISRSARFAERTARLRASTIREMLKVTQQPDVISFGGGLPAPELFPTAAIAQAAARVLERRGAAALQYSVTEGIPEMRRWVAERLTRRFGKFVEAEEVTIVNGSQQGLDLVAKILLDPGPRIDGYRPCADVAFETIAAHAGARTVGVVLTGMGSDAAKGAKAMKAAGGCGFHPIASGK